MQFSLLLIISALVIFILNIPFGYWRANVRKLSIQWFLAIHLPVIGIILFRVFSPIGFSWISFILFVAAFFFGQLIGSKIYLHREKKHPENLSSCMFMDLCKHS